VNECGRDLEPQSLVVYRPSTHLASPNGRPRHKDSENLNPRLYASGRLRRRNPDDWDGACFEIWVVEKQSVARSR
jgi:hypothetical protein